MTVTAFREYPTLKLRVGFQSQIYFFFLKLDFLADAFFDDVGGLWERFLSELFVGPLS